MRLRLLCVLMLVLGITTRLHAIGQPRYIEDTCTRDCFPLAQGKSVAPIVVDATDYPGVVRAVHDLQMDVFRVTSQTPSFLNEPVAGPTAILVGTLGHSALIDRLI